MSPSASTPSFRTYPASTESRKAEQSLCSKGKSHHSRKPDDEAAKAAALAFERERKRSDAARKKEEAAREKRPKQQEQAIAKAERAIELANEDHERRVNQIEKDRAALEARSEAERVRWERQKQILESALRRARD